MDMVEYVYDKNSVTEENIFAGINLPRNIRQIGTPEEKNRIYIEDYVMTYLKQMANPNSSYARGAILVGEIYDNGIGTVIFISGAIALQNLELDLTGATFDGDTWDGIYQEVKKNFSDLRVVGWFLSRMGFSTQINDSIVMLHMNNFCEKQQVLFVMDSLEDDDAFYMEKDGGLQRQSGYFIYYARNETMQNYMIGENTETVKQNAIDEKDGEVIENYKKILDERSRTAKIDRINRRLSMICSGLSVAVLALGIAVFSNYQMLEVLQTKLVENGLITYNEEKKEESQSLQEKTELVDEKKVESFSKNETQKGVVSVDTPKGLKEGSTECMANISQPRYYIVQTGDTLTSISFKMYNSVNYVAELMEANSFSNSDDIYEGEKIVIPNLEDVN